MIFRHSPYGWGIFAIPMARDGRTAEVASHPAEGCAVGHLRSDLPWRGIFTSLLASGLCLLALLLCGLLLPHASSRPQPAPVAVSVRLPQKPVAPEKVVPPPAAAPVKAPAPPPKPLPVARQAPASPPAPAAAPPQVRMLEEKPPAPQSPPAETELPAPKSADYRFPPPPRVGATLPQKAVALPAIRDEALPARPADRRRHPLPETAALPPAPRESLALPAAESIELPQAAPRAKSPRTAAVPSPPTLRGEVRISVPSPETALPPPAFSGQATARTAPPALPEHERKTAVFLAEKVPAVSLGKPALEKQPKPAAAAARQPGGASFEFLDRVPRAELDRSLLVSLNRLNTCRDPGAERKLKTRLATLLSRAGVCRSGGVLFDVLYPESAYSLHVDLYNYEQIEFHDRCAALRQAVACFAARR